MDHLLSNFPISRKEFLKGLGLLSSLAVMMTFGSCEDLAEAIQNRPTRRRLRTGSPEVDHTINLYKTAITQMNALGGSDRRNWLMQAEIHGWATPRNNSYFNYCAHYTNHFFSWHRAYLHQFETICRNLSNDRTFALPYWNWVLDRHVPSQFTAQGSNPLYSPRERDEIPNIPPLMYHDEFFGPVAMDRIFAEPDFELFGRGIESGPHNSVHSFIGGQYVLGTGNSPEDPIFWSHHCMVDYCWYDWNINRGNNNTDDPAWMNTSWDHFSDADGNQRTISVVETLLMPLIAYQYEPSPIGSLTNTLAIRTKRLYKEITERVKKGAPSYLEIKERETIAENKKVIVNEIFSQGTAMSISKFEKVIAESRTERVFAEIVLNELPLTNDFFVRVFVNLPSDAKDRTRKNPHYAGSFAIFGSGTATDRIKPEHLPRFTVELSDTIRRLRKEGILSADDNVSIQLMPVRFDDEQKSKKEEVLSVMKIDVTVARIRIELKRK